MKLFKIHVPIYDFELWVSTHRSYTAGLRELRKKLPFNPVGEDDGFGGGFWGHGHHGGMWLSARSHVQHEVLHAVFHILRHKGVPLTEASEEAYTYLADWLTQEVLRGF